MMKIKCDLEFKCKHRSKNGFHTIIFDKKDEKRDKIHTNAIDILEYNDLTISSINLIKQGSANNSSLSILA